METLLEESQKLHEMDPIVFLCVFLSPDQHDAHAKPMLYFDYFWWMVLDTNLDPEKNMKKKDKVWIEL